MKPMSRSALGYLMSAPLLLWLVVTIAMPLVYQIWISLTSARTIGGTPKFIGLINYSKMLSNPAFFPAFGRSLIWAFGGAVLQIIPAALVAAILNMKFRWQQLARTWIMISWVVPTIVVVFVWRLILNVDHGVADYILMHSRIISKPADFLGSPNFALLTTMLINAWRWFPFLTIIIIAGLRRIPEDCYDAAKVDGATAWKRLTAITLPLLQPVFYVSGLMGTLWSINVFDIIWLSTRGGPLSKTETIPVLIYERAFEGFSLSQASAIAVVLAIFLGIFSAVYILFVPAGDAEQEVI
jgi:multiple sugar transport system permease protein